MCFSVRGLVWFGEGFIFRFSNLQINVETDIITSKATF